ncbi:uncharacterized protein [Nicotiana sylvestris]|uniref:uncharacterized protein n=1 Tax=Nicotiana sylvestris TaxID=4096 RepID=UPI00388CA953
MSFADALATLSSMIQHPDKNFIDPIQVKIYDQPAYYAHVEEELDGKPWFHNVKEYLAKGEYLEFANPIQKHTLRRLSNNFFHSEGILYRRTPDLGLLRGSHSRQGGNSLIKNHIGSKARRCRMGEKSLRAASSYRWKKNECSLPW